MAIQSAFWKNVARGISRTRVRRLPPPWFSVTVTRSVLHQRSP